MKNPEKNPSSFGSYKLVNLSDLIPYEKNARTHSKNQIGQIKNSITEFGFTNPILIDEQNNLIAGHGRLQAAKSLKLKELPAVVLTGLTEQQKRALILADNKIAANAGWDEQLLRDELELLKATDYDLLLTGFSDEEINDLLKIEKIQGLTDEDEVPEVQENPISKLGDVWILGNHKLMCGDSTSITDVEKLMGGGMADMVFTDPPYGVSAVGGRSQTIQKKNIKKIANDDKRGGDLKQFIINALSILPLKKNSSFYVCYDQKTQFEFSGALKEIGWNQKNTIIWNKNNFGLSGQKGYRPKYELIAFGSFGDEYCWHGDNSQADVWDIARPTERFGNHPTPKPVELVERAINNSSKKKELILDLFGGSGSTLIACEKTERINCSMELDPKYCDVIIKRWQGFTGNEAIHAETQLIYNSYEKKGRTSE